MKQPNNFGRFQQLVSQIQYRQNLIFPYGNSGITVQIEVRSAVMSFMCVILE